MPAALGYRYYGGGSEDYASPVTPGVMVEVWDSMEGGARVTDLLDVSGAPVANARPVSLSASDGGPLDVGLFLFQAPLSAPITLWLDRDAGASRRIPIHVMDLPARIAEAISTAEQASADVAAYGPTAEGVTALAQDAIDIAEATQAQQDLIADTFALREELYNVATIPAGLTATGAVPAFAIMYDTTIHDVILWFSGAVAEDNTNYWTVALHIYRNGGRVATPLVSKTTKASGGEDIVVHKPWGMAGGGIDPSVADLLPGDRVVLEATMTGTPSGGLVGPIHVGWR